MQEMSDLSGHICQNFFSCKSQKVDAGCLEHNRNFLTRQTEKSKIRASDGVRVPPVPMSPLCFPLAPFSGSFPQDVTTWPVPASGASSLVTLATEGPPAFMPAALTKIPSVSLASCLGSGPVPTPVIGMGLLANIWASRLP